MKKGIRWLALAPALLYSLGAQAQTMTPSTLNASGGSGEIAGNIYEYSVGEMVLVHTATAPNLIVTQGVLQPQEEASGIADAVLPEKALTVYPNPSSDILYLQPDMAYGGKLVLSLTDMTGRSLVKKECVLKTGTEKQTIDLSMFAAGTYLLYATFTHNNQDFVRSFKVQKLK